MPLPFILSAAISALAGSTGGVAAAGTAMLVNKLAIKGTPTKLKEVFTTEEAMKVLGMSKPTILKKMKDGLIPYEVSGGRGRGGYHIRREALENYAENNNIVPNWGEEDIPTNGPANKLSVEETIKLKKLQKEEAELELEEIQLEPDDSVDYKRKLIQAKKKIKKLDKDIQALKMILMSLDTH